MGKCESVCVLCRRLWMPKYRGESLCLKRAEPVAWGSCVRTAIHVSIALDTAQGFDYSLADNYRHTELPIVVAVPQYLYAPHFLSG